MPKRQQEPRLCQPPATIHHCPIPHRISFCRPSSLDTRPSPLVPRPLSLLLAALLPLCVLAEQAPVNLALRRPATTDSAKGKGHYYSPALAVDGLVSDKSRCMSATRTDPHWLAVELAAETWLGSAHLYSGYGGEPTLFDFELQSWDGAAWQTIPGTRTKGNTKTAQAVIFEKPVKTAKLRLLATQCHQHILRIKEFTLWAPQMDGGTPPLGAGVQILDEAAPEAGLNIKTEFEEHPVMVNQSGYNLDWPKRFTAPLAKGEAEFTITPADGSNVLYSGKVLGGVGDFTDFRPAATGQEYVITVTGGELKPGRSDPFAIAPLWLERVCLDPTLRFMSDCRSVVGTHPSAYGACPWRDGTDYDFAIPSLVLLYLANPAYYEQAPVEINWQQDRAKLLAPGFKFFGDGGGQPAFAAARIYYTKLEAPVGAHVPDLVQLLHWGVGFYLAKAGAAEGEPTTAKLPPPQTLEQLAFFLYVYPHIKPYISDRFYATARDYVFAHWDKAGLFGVQTKVGSFKGYDCPGHSIMPNLLLYEVARREGRAEAERYFNAAYDQTQWIIEKLDLHDPHTTKGQRMAEIKLPTGLVLMQRDYGDRAPAGLAAKLEQWAQSASARSANLWDFRKYDDANWTLPRFEGSKEHGGAGWNEPGNIAGFPGLCFAVASVLPEAAQHARLEQLAAAHFDDLFGRNPLAAHSSERGPQDYRGVERGWPKKFSRNTCARIELCRGGLNSSCASEHYPFNPGGAFRHCEGWVNFNTAFNVGLAYAMWHDTRLALRDDAGQPVTQLKTGQAVQVHLRAPTDHATQFSVTITNGKTEQKLPLQAAAAAPWEHAATVKLSEQPDGQPGTLVVKKGDALKFSYGHGFLRRELALAYDTAADAWRMKP